MFAQVNLMSPEDETTKRMHERLLKLLEDLRVEEKGKGAGKPKNLPRGDYKEFVRLVSVGIV